MNLRCETGAQWYGMLAHERLTVGQRCLAERRRGRAKYPGKALNWVTFKHPRLAHGGRGALPINFAASSSEGK